MRRMGDNISGDLAQESQTIPKDLFKGSFLSADEVSLKTRRTL